MQVIQERRRLILIVLVIIVLLCLIGVLARNIFFPGGDGVAADTPTPMPTQEGPDVVITPEEEEEVTPTPTRVISEEPAATPTEEPTPESTVEPTTEPTTAPTVPPTPIVSEPGPGVIVEPVQVEELLKNGGFEEGFDEETGVGLHWDSFKTDGADITFSAETSEVFIHEGTSAQRISVDNAFQPDRYGGIYQKVEVAPNQIYTFTLHGQIRTFFGDANASSFGYRVQYAVDHQGGENWRSITPTAWIELPWDEQLLDTSEVTFSEYTAPINAQSDEITIFVRVWNKWPDPKLSEYTFDSLSLVGPAAGQVTMVSPDTEDALIDQPLPITGTGDSGSLLSDGRFWGAVLVLLLLAAGAIYRARWGY